MFTEPRSKDFARNIDFILTIRGLSRKEAAELIGVPYKWLRRIVSQGLSRSDRRNADHLRKLATYFGLGVEDLWRTDLIDLRTKDGEQTSKSLTLNGSRKQLTVERIESLLATGDYEYLHEVIESLHRRAEARKSSHSATVASESTSEYCGEGVLVNWTGGKRHQAPTILNAFPPEINTYYEPFVGGGSVLYALLGSQIMVQRFVCGDICPALIDLWTMVKDRPDRLISEYERMWVTFRATGTGYYYSVRELFNRTRGACELLFLVWTCQFGFVHFNRRGEFTSGPDSERFGVRPDDLTKPLYAWHQRLKGRDVQFVVGDYRTVHTAKDDFVYLDPPYPTTTLYYGRIQYDEFFRWLESQAGGYALSLGTSAASKPEVVVPAHLYKSHIEIDCGHTSRSLIAGRTRSSVTERLYLRPMAFTT